MKRILSILLIVVLLIGVVACGNKEKTNDIEVPNNSGDQVEDKPIIKYFNEADLDKFAATQTIILPETITTLEVNSFQNMAISQLIFKGSKQPNCPTNLFNSCNKLIYINVYDNYTENTFCGKKVDYIK